MFALFAIYTVLLLVWALVPKGAGIEFVKELLTDADGPESVHT